MRANIRPELIEQAIVRHYRERPVKLTPREIAERTGAIEALAAVSTQAIEQVRKAKTELITKLKARCSSPPSGTRTRGKPWPVSAETS